MVAPHEVLYLNEPDHAQAVDGFRTRWMGHQQAENDYLRNSNFATCTGTDIAGNIPTESHHRGNNIAMEYGITISKPKYQQFAVKDVRLKTFKNWPHDVKQRPEELADAGFFYSGNGDAVFCFYCGQGLKDWEEEDTPCGEHARWSPECAHLLNIKGSDFVRLERLRDTDPAQYIAERPQAGHVAENRPTTTDSETDTWNNPAVESLLQNGYNKDMVRKAVILFRRDRGESSPLAAAELLSIIFDLEEGNISYEDAEKKDNELQRDLLRKENEELRKSTYCRRCSTRFVSVVFLPCGHLCTCIECAPSVKNCLMCGGFIKGTVRTYLV